MVASGDSWHAYVCRPAVVGAILLTFVDIKLEVSADNSPMTEESVAKTVGAKKKSFFQITKVQVDQGNAEEDGDEDGDDIDGDEDGEEENMAKENVTVPSVVHGEGTVWKAAVDSRVQQSTSLQSSSTSSIANGATTLNTASKFRVVRITTNTLNKKYTRGRWVCWDFITEPDSVQHSPNDHEHEIVAGDSARRESALDTRALHSFAEPSHGANRTGCVKGDVRRVCDDSPSSAATATDPSNHLSEISRTSNVVGQGRDPLCRVLGNEDQGARDRLNQVLATVRNLIIDYSTCEQRDRDKILEQNTSLRVQIQHLQDREHQLLAEIENFRADNQRLQEDNRKLVVQLALASNQQPPSKS